MATDDRAARNAIRVWMRQVLEQKEWTASDWARLAGTSPTNITRVLGPNSTIIPSGATIAKLAAAAGSQPALGSYARIGLSKLKVFRLGSRLMETADTIDSPGPVPDKTFAVQLTKDHPNLALKQGDLLIVAPHDGTPPAPGRIVIARWHEDHICGRVAGHFLVWSDADDPAPLEDIEIIGIAIQVVRSL